MNLNYMYENFECSYTIRNFVKSTQYSQRDLETGPSLHTLTSYIKQTMKGPSWLLFYFHGSSIFGYTMMQGVHNIQWTTATGDWSDILR